MHYLKTFSINFLVVFFANYLLPGLYISDPTRLPHIGGEIPFALGAGLLNTLILPVLKMAGREPSLIRIGMVVVILNFACYGLLRFVGIGVHLESVEGYIFASLAVSLGGFLTNFFELKRSRSGGSSEPPAFS